MASKHEHTNECSPSTTWEYRKIRVRSAPAGDSPPTAVRPGFAGVRRRDRHQKLWIEIRYVGGQEASWLVSARGRIKRFPGHLCLHDVLSEVNEGRLSSFDIY